MDAHNETIFGMVVFLGPVGMGEDKNVFQNYFLVKRYGGVLPNHYIRSNKPLYLLTKNDS